jgi:gliding motility associated protien GldN
MKRIYAICVVMLLFSFGISTVMMAQTHKKKKKKHTTEHNTAEADSIAAARSRDSLARIAAATPAAEPVDTSHQLTDGLVADTTGYLNMANITLDTSKPVDGFYKMRILEGARPFAFPKENKFNVKFYKRIWRTIDLNDSVNKIFAMPGQSLMRIILEAIKAQKLIAYADEGFTKTLTYEKVMKRITPDSFQVVLTDPDTTYKVASAFDPDSVKIFEIKEDLFIDKVRGRLITQIIGLAPVSRLKGSTGEDLGTTHGFYLYFPQCRNVFAAKEAYDTQRDMADLSFDDVFIQRNFHSTIFKESNPGDLRIIDKFPNDEKAQKAEADRIEREIQSYKNNLWKH